MPEFKNLQYYSRFNNYYNYTAGENSEKTDLKQDAGVAAKPKEAQKPRKKFDFGGVSHCPIL